MTWPPFTPKAVQTRVRSVVAAFVVGAVAVFAAAGWIASLVGGNDGGAWAWLPGAAAYGVCGGLLVASVACLAATFALTKAVRARFDPSFPWRKDISDRLTKGRGEEIAVDQRMLAVRYASILAVYLPFQLAQLVLLYLGLVGLQLAALLGGGVGDNGGLRIGIAVLVTAAVAVAAPYALLQLARVRRYLREHPFDATAGFEPAK